jgi:hypothetical protein
MSSLLPLQSLSCRHHRCCHRRRVVVATTAAVVLSWPPLPQPSCCGHHCRNRRVVATIVAAAAAMPMSSHLVMSRLGLKPLVSRARAILSQAEPFNGSWLETAQERFKLFFRHHIWIWLDLEVCGVAQRSEPCVSCSSSGSLSHDRDIGRSQICSRSMTHTEGD